MHGLPYLDFPQGSVRAVKRAGDFDTARTTNALGSIHGSSPRDTDSPAAKVICNWCHLLKATLAFVLVLPLASCASFNTFSIKSIAPQRSDSDQCMPIRRECQRLCFDTTFQDVCHGKASQEKWIELSQKCAQNLRRMMAGEMTPPRPSCTEMELVLERLTNRLSPALSDNLKTSDWIKAVASNLYPEHRDALMLGLQPPR